MPVRMCIVCRNRSDKAELIRAVLSDGRAVVDKTDKAQQRGFYLCPGCIDKVRKKRVLERVIRRSVEAEVYEKFIADAEERAHEKELLKTKSKGYK